MHHTASSAETLTKGEPAPLKCGLGANLRAVGGIGGLTWAAPGGKKGVGVAERAQFHAVRGLLALVVGAAGALAGRAVLAPQQLSLQ